MRRGDVDTREAGGAIGLLAVELSDDGAELRGGAVGVQGCGNSTRARKIGEPSPGKQKDHDAYGRSTWSGCQ